MRSIKRRKLTLSQQTGDEVFCVQPTLLKKLGAESSIAEAGHRNFHKGAAVHGWQLALTQTFLAK